MYRNPKENTTASLNKSIVAKQNPNAQLEELTIDCIPLSALLHSLNWTDIDILIIDTEGARKASARIGRLRSSQTKTYSIRARSLKPEGPHCLLPNAHTRKICSPFRRKAKPRQLCNFTNVIQLILVSSIAFMLKWFYTPIAMLNSLAIA